MAASKPHIILAVINDLTGDQRMHRICSTLADEGYAVTLVGRSLPDSLPLSERPYQTHRLRLRIHRGKWFYLMFNVRLLLWLLRQPCTLIVANDLDTLLACRWASRLRGLPLLYDSHEIFTEVPELIHRPRTRAVWRWLERQLVPQLAAAYTVNESLARHFQGRYGVPFTAIRNLPFARPLPAVQTPPKVLIYQGALNLGRGIELMIRSMPHLPEFELWIVGKGDVEQKLHELAASLPAARVRFWGFTPLERLPEITRQAGLGLSLEEDLGANYHYASPNKVYDYLQAGLPVLVSELPEMAALVSEWGCGEVLPPTERHPELVAARLRDIFESATYARYRQQARLAAKELVWECEKEKLLALYRQMLHP